MTRRSGAQLKNPITQARLPPVVEVSDLGESGVPLGSTILKIIQINIVISNFMGPIKFFTGVIIHVEVYGTFGFYHFDKLNFNVSENIKI